MLLKKCIFASIYSLLLMQIIFLQVGEIRILYAHRILILFTILVFLAYLIVFKQKLSVKPYTGITLFLLYCTAQIAFLFIYDKNMFLNSITLYVQLVIGYLFLLTLLNTKFDHNFLISIFKHYKIIIIILTSYGFYQVFARNLGLPFGYLEFGDNFQPEALIWSIQYSRPSSLFIEPGTYANFLLPYIIFVFFGYLFNVFKDFSIGVVHLIWIWVNFILTGSLGAFITAFFMFLFFVIYNFGLKIFKFNWHSLKKYELVSIILLLFIIIIYIFDVPIIGFSRVEHLFDKLFALMQQPEIIKLSGSIGQRLTRFYASFQIWFDHVILGVGFNNAYIFYKNIHFPNFLLQDTHYVGHTMIGTILTSTGLFGLILFIGNIFYIIFRLLKYNSNLSVCFAFFLITFFLVAQFSLNIAFIYSWFILGVTGVFFRKIYQIKEL